MARITVEDCIDKFESRFELVLVASNRARKLHSGEAPTIDKDNDKPTVIALREIADESVSVDSLKEKLIQEYQTVSPLDEEELSLDYSGSETEKNDKIKDDEQHLNEQNNEANISNEDESQLNYGNDEANILNEVDSSSALKSNETTDVPDDHTPENK